MKRSACFLVTALILLSGCARALTAPLTPSLSGERSASVSEQTERLQPTAAHVGETEIQMQFGEVEVTALLDDSQTSRDFLSLLPLTLDMTRFYDREYAAHLGDAVISQEGEQIADFENGDVTYYVAGHALAVFFDGADRSDQSGLIRMGRITSDVEELAGLSGDAQVTITLAEQEGEANMTYDVSVFTNVEITDFDPAALTAEEQAVLCQQARYCQAMTEADTDTLRELVPEDATFTHMSGRQQTREEYFADIESGALRYFTIGMENPEVEVEGDRAAVTFTSVLNANAYGAQGTYRMHGTHHWELRDGAWRVAR